jgi:hypothetical protein
MRVAIPMTSYLAATALMAACSPKPGTPEAPVAVGDSSVVAAVAAVAPEDAKAYGKALTLTRATPISAILSDPKAYDGQRVLVQGPIVEVCETRGCWVRIGSDRDFEAIRFKVEDGVITFPLSAKGSTVLAEGVVAIKNYTREQALAQAREMAKERGTLATFDSTKITGPVTEIMLMGEGARVW